MNQRLWKFVLVVMLFGTVPAFGQATTGTITGRAVDSSGGLLPGVEVSIASPAMIGGARESVTDTLGTYRFGQLQPGVYQVTFHLAGFRTLAIEGVTVQAGGTMTINGPMQLDTVSETVTVMSTTPTIDLQSTTVGVNWTEQQMENLPYGRGIRGLARLVPGVSPTQFDVGGNTVG
ncbi:MAG: carboxypeptidase-like regulatory domain-containing protein, partial [Vicinamibacterales bacterium]